MRLFCVFFIFSLFSHSQSLRNIDISFKFRKRSIDIDYFVIENNKIIDTLVLKDSQLLLPLYSKNDLDLLVKFKKEYLILNINPKQIYYLKISKLPFSFSNFFRKKYEINQGFDYVEIVESKKIKNFYRNDY